MNASDLLALLMVLAGCVLLWPATRRLGLSPAGASIGVAGCGLVALPVAAAGAADAAGPALLCLVLAVPVTGPDAPRRAAAAGLALAGVLSAPVVAVALLVGAAFLLASPSSGPNLSDARRTVVYAAGLGAAVLVAVLATGARPWALPPGPVTAGAPVGVAAVVALVLVLTGLTWSQLPWARPIAAGGVALGVCAFVPGTAVAVLVLVAPLLGVLTGAALTELPVPARWRRIGGGFGVLALVAAATPLAAGGPGAGQGVLPAAARPSAGAEPRGVRPVRVVIPALDVDSGLVELHTTDTGVLLPPERPDVAGWFAAGPVPGDIGPAVIGGHVDSNAGPGVFLLLSRLRDGDAVSVERSDGSTARFTVSSVGRYPKDRFPTERVYGPTPAPELRLVTCGGTFDRVEQSYRDNVVVEAVRA